MIKASELRKMAEEVNTAKQVKDDENTKEGVEFFAKMAEANAKNGRFEKGTTCLVKKGDVTYYCQTENDGNGFTINNIEEVIKGLEDLGFQIEFKSKESGYSPFKISW